MTDIACSDAASLPPATMRDLGPGAVSLFATMHSGTALRCHAEGVLFSTREELKDPKHVVVGDPSLVRRRLNVRMPPPWPGVVGDYARLTLTPKTAAALGSCGPKSAPGATRLRATDLVVAVLPLESLTNSALLTGFSDRNPIGGATVEPIVSPDVV